MKSVRLALSPSLNRVEEQKTCARHGPYRAVSYTGPDGAWSICPRCELDALTQERRESADEARRLAVSARLSEAGIPRRFRESTLSNFVAATTAQRRVLNLAEAYAADFKTALETGRCLAFVGAPGTGKTHLAAGLVREVIAQGYSARMTTVGDYVRDVKDSAWGKAKLKTEGEVIGEYRAPSFLVLDEVGVQFGSLTEETLIFTLMNKRYEDLKPTLVISNEEEDGLERYLGPRTFDRLRDGGGLIIPFRWESARGSRLTARPTEAALCQA